MNHSVGIVGFALLSSVLLLSPLAWGSQSLDSETTFGSNLLSEGLNYNGSDGGKTNREKWNWNAGYTYSHFTQAATSYSPAITDDSSEVVGGFGYQKDWEVGLGLTYQTTPAENLHAVGPNLYAGYTFVFGPEKETPEKRQALTPRKSSPGGLNSPQGQADNAEQTDVKNSQDEVSDSDEPFRPSLTLKGIFGFLGYTETTSTTAPRKTTTTKRLANDTINQSSFGFEASGSPTEWATLSLTYTKYHYNKDVKQFLAALDDPRSVQLGASNFASTLAGFPAWTLAPTAIFYLDAWSLECDGTITENQVDHTKSYSEKAILGRDLFASLRAGVGLEHDSSATSGVQNLGIVRLGYDF